MVTPLDLAFLALGLGAAALSVALLVGVWQGRRPRAAGSSGGPAAPAVEVGMRDLAEERDRRMLAVREDALGPDHPEVAAALTIVAAHLHGLGRFAEEEPLLRRALAIRERVHGQLH